jgi:hypothetical protein
MLILEHPYCRGAWHELDLTWYACLVFILVSDDGLGHSLLGILEIWMF